jgi:hypothetical protein
MISKSRYLYLSLIILFLSGCTPQVLRQDIPVSTNPMGARIMVDGTPAGQTPGTVSLERNRDHIVTLVKENYRQEDVIVKRQFQSDKVFMKAVQSGVNAGLFHKDARMGINSGYSSYSMQEETGEAYILLPSAIKVNMIPLSARPAQTDEDEAKWVGLLPSGSAARVSPTDQGMASSSDDPPASTGLTTKDVLKAGIIAGAAAGAAQAKPVEKKWDTSSSSRTYTKPDGTVVTEKSGTSVGVGVNPAGMLQALDILMK